ncbi:hypothetical protein RJT34_15995 [Clitoria ternatea]|uniref:Uncharacterized protein n=1 Tax=Clitoria ternatea TaxID=43366 RepID=A0AAN9PDA4_CLITE
MLPRPSGPWFMMYLTIVLSDCDLYVEFGDDLRRQDDKWEHYLFEDDEPRLFNRKVTAQDLCLKLQKKSLHPGAQTGKSSVPGLRDLRERLSGTITPQPKSCDPPKP